MKESKRKVYISLLLPLLLLSSCKTRYPYIPQTHIEYRDRYHASHDTDTLLVSDTLIIKDSMQLRQRGDTVFVDRWHHELRVLRSKSGRSKRDTLYQRDSIHIQKPIAIEVPKNHIPRWAIWQIVGFWLLAALMAWLLLGKIRRSPFSLLSFFSKRFHQ